MGVGRSKDKMLKWGCLKDQDDSCNRETLLTMAHLSISPMAPESCTLEDLTLANQMTIESGLVLGNQKNLFKILTIT